jgi:hypothetical protein
VLADATSSSAPVLVGSSTCTIPEHATQQELQTSTNEDEAAASSPSIFPECDESVALGVFSDQRYNEYCTSVAALTRSRKELEMQESSVDSRADIESEAACSSVSVSFGGGTAKRGTEEEAARQHQPYVELAEAGMARWEADNSWMDEYRRHAVQRCAAAAACHLTVLQAWVSSCTLHWGSCATDNPPPLNGLST